MGCGSSQEAGPGGLSEDEIRTILTVERVVNSLSIVGSSSIIACGSLCLFQAYLVSIFGLSSVLWTACISHCLFHAIRYHDVEVHRFQFRYHLFAWGVPSFLALVPQFTNSYGNENGTCWILQSHPALRFIQFYIPLWAVIGYNGTVYLKISANLNAILRANPESRREDAQVFWRLGLYPAVLLLCWAFASINRLQNSLNPGHPSFPLFLLHRLFGGSQGLLNCLVYGLNASVQAKLYHAVCGGRGDVEEGDGKSEVQLALAPSSQDP